jgi:hypothetical protein
MSIAGDFYEDLYSGIHAKIKAKVLEIYKGVDVYDPDDCVRGLRDIWEEIDKSL